MILHVAVPVSVAFAGYRREWLSAALWMLATLVVDLDHLLADPVYDPERCSMGFHPLHGGPALVLYLLMCVAPMVSDGAGWAVPRRRVARSLHLVGLGLLIHMLLDSLDCVL